MDQNDELHDSPILFSGVPEMPSPDVFDQARKDHPAWVRAMDSAYEEFASRPENLGIYAKPGSKGGTIEQVWLVMTFWGVETYCLLAHPVPQKQVTRITRLLRYTARQVVDAMKALQRVDGQVYVTTLHYDGKTGHCIVVESYDEERDRFIYHDPWPLKSLLCKENNRAGVDAQPEGTRWSVTAKELESVLFASLVLPHQWARLQGLKFDLFLNEWKKGEFYGFFHLKQTFEAFEEGITARLFAAGTFKDEVRVIVNHKESGKITRAVLLLDRQWIATNPLPAFEISKSFILSFAPDPVRNEFAGLSKTLWSLSDPAFAMSVKSRNPEESPETRFVQVFLGLEEIAVMSTDFADLIFENTEEAGKLVLQVQFRLL